MKRLITLSFALTLAACSTVTPERDVFPNDPDFAPVSSQSLEAPPSNTGSLFQPRYSIGLYTDQQATKVGDIITVTFDEQYQSSKSAETSADKSSNNSMSVPNVLGTVPGWKNLTMDSETANDRQFSGKGEADRSNSLSGQISVTVSDILPNGVLRIRGEKWLTLSEGDEYIRISGMIRPQDITPDNTVASSKVADARISFGGRGNLNNSTKQGWADRIFMSPWWPF